MEVIEICIGSACHLKGSYAVIEKFQHLIQTHHYEEKVIVKAAFCLGHCTNAVSVKYQDTVYGLQEDTVEDFFMNTIMEG